MTIEYIRYIIPEGLADQFEADWAAATAVLQQSKFCTGCELSRCEEKPDHYILRIEWTSTKDHTQGFRSSPDFRKFLTHVRAHFKHAKEMNHYTPLPIKFQK